MLLKIRETFPDKYIFPAVAGALLREEAASYKHSGSVALLETYSTCFVKYFGSHSSKKHFDQKIEVARNTDLIYKRGKKNGAIILLGLNAIDAYELESSIPRLEDQVRYIKKNSAGDARDIVVL